MRVMMVPNALNLVSGESGIHTLVRAWTKHLPAAGIDLVNPKADSFDVLAVHAGMTREYGDSAPLVSHLHGLYFTADYHAADWEYKTNRSVIDSVRHATTVTVPSAWVSEVLQRDMHLNPVVVGHGIDWQDWQHDEPNDEYVLWNKNRTGDVCDPKPIGELARRFPQQRFLTTFAPANPTPNIKATGTVPHKDMRKMVQRASVYLATTKETWGIGIVEAMAAGIPVLGFRQGGILDTVVHGDCGYLAKVGDYDDLARGLEYCLRYRRVLGQNGRAHAAQFSWQRVANQLFDVYTETLNKFHQPPTVSVIIPCYNLSHTLERAVNSVLAQTYPAHEIIVVNNNSTDDTEEIAKRMASQPGNVIYTNCEAQGVAHARNHGIRMATGKHIVCLDADDAIEPGFLDVCVKALEADRSLGVAYTRLQWVKADGTTGISQWPGVYNYDEFLKKRNQVPTCCCFRREMWERLGGYRQRYAPGGAGAEDAEFFLRAGAMGWGARLVTEEPLFVYSWGTGRVSGDKNYVEPDWLAGKPWIADKQHPFASVATPAKQSHRVRQYDQPIVSVVIPCGPGHEQYLVDALDSLEAQTFRQWEAIVTFDTGKQDYDELLTAFPFVRPVYTNRAGAGAARNAGAKLARGKFLLFLDADDWLKPTALEKMLAAWNEHGAIAYSDYIGHAYIEDKTEIDKLKLRRRLIAYDERTRIAQVLHQAFEYDCERAVAQPQLNGGQFYIWNLISSLVPRAWHNEIDGFDEQMPSWEDWDYWLRLARNGKCFVRIEEPLLEYRFFSGTRRETGGQIHKSLLEYMTEKYKGAKAMACGGCGGKRKSAPAATSQAQPIMSARNSAPTAPASQMIWVQLNDGNVGQHPITGMATKQRYGYRKHGEVFLMNGEDVKAMQHKFIVVPDPNAKPIEPEEPEPETPAPKPFVTWSEDKKPESKPKKTASRSKAKA